MIKRTVPLALALLSASNPRLQYLDTLSKFSHDSDPEVSHNAILAMGVVGAGAHPRKHLNVPHYDVIDASLLWLFRDEQCASGADVATVGSLPQQRPQQPVLRAHRSGSHPPGQGHAHSVSVPQ